jgi:hypothetical protein
VTDGLGAVQNIAELLSWIGLGIGIVLLVPGYVLRLLHARWREQQGVVVALEGDVVTFRWFGDGGIHEGTGDQLEKPLAVGDDVKVWAKPSRPDLGRIEHTDHLGTTLRVTGFVLFAVGFVSAVASIILMLVLG